MGMGTASSKPGFCLSTEECLLVVLVDDNSSFIRRRRSRWLGFSSTN